LMKPRVATTLGSPRFRRSVPAGMRPGRDSNASVAPTAATA
jgi:hypothetical protein